MNQAVAVVGEEDEVVEDVDDSPAGVELCALDDLAVPFIIPAVCAHQDLFVVGRKSGLPTRHARI